jgi:hypothetical protein
MLRRLATRAMRRSDDQALYSEIVQYWTALYPELDDRYTSNFGFENDSAPNSPLV